MPTITQLALVATATAAAMMGSTATAQAKTPIDCGVDLAAPAIAEAAQRQPPPPGLAGWQWSTRAFAGNFDPCAELSVALITLDRGTASSPVTAMLFHYNTYVQNAKPTPESFIRFDDVDTNKGHVVLAFDTPGACDACAPAATRYLWYAWQDNRVAAGPFTPPPAR
jgi:hypothetical protein